MFGNDGSVGASLLCALLVAVLFTATGPAAIGQIVSTAPDKTAEMAWVKQDGSRNIILYSALSGDAWSKPIPLSTENQNNLVPTLASDQQGRTFVAWSVINGSGSHLDFVVLRGEIIETGPVGIETGMSANMAPFLAVDHDGILWLAWAGNNGSTSDIYYSYREDGKWQLPMRAHAENDVPDILPELSVEQDGSVGVRWKTYSRNGLTMAMSTLKGAGVKPMTEKSFSPMAAGEASADPLACVVGLPAGDIELDKASLLSRCQKNAPSSQIQFLGKAMRNKRQSPGKR